MTLFLVALLGNVLAWCVHSAAWWLREKCLGLLIFCGSLITFFCLPITYLLCLLAFWVENYPESESGYYDYSEWPNLFFVALPWGLVCVTAAFHTRFLREDKFTFASAFCALMTEVAIAIISCVYVANKIEIYVDNSANILVWSFALTIIALALIRPQVVKVQKWLWQQVKPQRATNE